MADGVRVSVGKFLTSEESRRLSECQKNHVWISENYRRLAKEYPETWIAVMGQKVVGTGMSYESFLSELKSKYEFGPTEIAIRYIKSKPAESLGDVVAKII